jgi:hypothetical protein
LKTINDVTTKEIKEIEDDIKEVNNYFLDPRTFLRGMDSSEATNVKKGLTKNASTLMN